MFKLFEMWEKHLESGKKNCVGAIIKAKSHQVKFLKPTFEPEKVAHCLQN